MKYLPVNDGKYQVMVDDEDYERLKQFKWHVDSNGYPANKLYDQYDRLHECIIGKAPKGHVIHHKDHNIMNAQSANLEFVTQKTHVHHHKIKSSVTGFRGVDIKASGHFRARICINGSLKQLGTYHTAEEAARAYDEEAKKLHGKYAILNYPTT
jgi:HNH endonuclease